jgi:hypothetical protein
VICAAAARAPRRGPNPRPRSTKRGAGGADEPASVLGAASLCITLPNDPRLADRGFVAQGMAAGPTGCWRFTDGLTLRIQRD